MNKRVCTGGFYCIPRCNTLSLSQATRKAPPRAKPFDIVEYAYTLLLDNFFQNSYMLLMRSQVYIKVMPQSVHYFLFALSLSDSLGNLLASFIRTKLSILSKKQNKAWANIRKVKYKDTIFLFSYAFFVVFTTAVCVLFRVLKRRWPKKKSI